MRSGLVVVVLMLSGCGDPADGDAARCLTLPSRLEFGPVQHTCGRSQAGFAVVNACSGPVSLALEVQDPTAGCGGDPACRTFRTVASPRTLAPGEEAQVDLVATPAEVGTVSGSLVVTAWLGEAKTVKEVALVARGTERALITERFEPPPRLTVDVVLVLDTSPSMQARWENTAYSLRALGQWLGAEPVRMRVHLTTADVNPAPVRVVEGSGDPAALGAALVTAAAALPVTSRPSCARGLLAALEHVGDKSGPFAACITDSPDRAPEPATELQARLDAWGWPVQVVGPWPLPGFGGQAAQVCTSELDDGRLELLNGGRPGESICTADWFSWLIPVGRGEICHFDCRTRDQLQLSRRAVAGPRLVRVWNLEVPRSPSDPSRYEGRDSRGAQVWEWDPTTNVVRLDWLYALATDGPAVEVVYEPACD